MKLIVSTFAAATLVALSSVVYAQTEPIWRNDPTYSTHNYKHPNKAAAVQRRAMEPGVTVSFPQPGAARVANYKMPQPGQVPMGGVVMPHTPSTDLADRNYKMPQLFRSAVQVKPAVAEKTVNQPTNTSD